MTRCRICCAPIAGGGNGEYHESCSRDLFGVPVPPKLPYTWDELNDLAVQVIRHSIAVPGVQPKLSLHLEQAGSQADTRLTLVGLEGGLILKPPVAQYPEMPELEHLVMRMAALFGIRTAPCGLLPLASGEMCYLTRRLDRRDGRKIHMEDFCQITDNLTEQKYRGGSMEKVAKTVLRYCSNTGLDALRLYELALYCFLTGNSDMHLKNFSIMHEDSSEIVLAPAYDLLPTRLLLPADDEDLALAMGGRQKKLGRGGFQRWGRKFLGLTDRQLENVRNRFIEALPAALRFVDQGFVSAENRGRLVELMVARGERLGLGVRQCD